ncbi:MAG: type I 3-dehydroquinate dehydratase [Coprobacillus cateniformis]
MPIVGKNEKEIIQQFQSFQGLPYDVIELRIDFYQEIRNSSSLKSVLQKLRSMTDLPILLTYRSSREGGQMQLSDEEYQTFVKQACESQCIDLIDIELMSGNTLVFQLVEIAHQNDIKVVMSNHDFDKTPCFSDMMNRLEQMEILGADICKLAVMPITYKDVITLLNMTLEMSHKLERPIVTMAMGKIGVISRITGELTGSSMTFASAGKISAPGQMNVIDMQVLLEAIHHDRSSKSKIGI